MLEVPASYFVFPLFSLHIIHYHYISWRKFNFCKDKNNYVENSQHKWYHNGSISNIILFPIYLWIVFSLLRNKMLRTFTRLGFGIVVCLLGVTSLFMIDVVGHSLNIDRPPNQT